MRVSRKKAAENRDRIVETASRMFREGGFEGVGVDAIMKRAGLTHGGFYGHFGSKDDLAAEAVTRALERGVENLGRYRDLRDLVAEFLSQRHYADRANGCAIAALGSDMVRQRRRRSPRTDGACACAAGPLRPSAQGGDGGEAAQARDRHARWYGWGADARPCCR